MILIIDYGSQYTELIARQIRELSVFSEVVSRHLSLADIQAKSPTGIILSGGPMSVDDDHADTVDPGLFELDIPVLGICYGMQLISVAFGGVVTSSKTSEYGRAALTVTHPDSRLFSSIPTNTDVWMSHSDSVTQIAPGFQLVAITNSCPAAAIEHTHRAIYGIQFHPEVSHTDHGKTLIKNFVVGICNAPANWTSDGFIDRAMTQIRQTVGKDNVLCAVSGGVDSAVVAALLNKAIGSQLTCMFIDTGYMRVHEGALIKTMFEDQFECPLHYVDAQDHFYAALKGVTDPEKKRKIIGREFIRVFEREVKTLGGNMPYLAQGTLYPDVIESAKFNATSATHTIKTHHNVGGLPDDMDFHIIEPLKMLFKDEVRQVGLALGLSEAIVHRHPFPGPGLAIRILGEPTSDRVHMLQKADAILLDEIRSAGLYHQIWQAFVVLLPVKSVGVMGDQRTYQNTCAIRCVSSDNAMTATWYPMPYDVLETLSNRIINEVDGINRVVYDVSSKPPATIEWE